MQLQLRPDDDDRAAGVVDALAQQVLPEAPLLAPEQIGQRPQRAIGSGVDDGAATAPVVDQGVDGLLQHALLVAHDHLGRALLHQLLEAVVAVDQAAVEIVEIRGGEAAPLHLHHRAQVGRHDRHGLEDHPGGVVAALKEAAGDLEALARLGALVAARGVHLLDQLGLELLEVDRLEQLAHGIGAHAGLEVVRLDDAHLAAHEIDLDATGDVAAHVALVRQLVTELDAVAVHDDGLVLVRVHPGARHDDAGGLRQPHGAVRSSDDLLRGVDRADHLLAGDDGCTVAHQDVHGGVDLVDLAARPAHLERHRDLLVLRLAGAERGDRLARQHQLGACRSLRQDVALFDELAAAGDDFHAGRDEVGVAHVLVVDVPEEQDAAVVADRQQFDDALLLGTQLERQLELRDGLPAGVLLFLDPGRLRHDETGIAKLAVVERELPGEAVLGDAR